MSYSILAMDVLADVVAVTRIRGRVFCRVELPPRWGMRVAPNDNATFHVVGRGGAWVSLSAGGPPQALAAGDVVLLPHGSGHQLQSHLDEPAVPFEEYLTARARAGGEPAGTVLICGSYRFEADGKHPLFALLPPLVHVRAGAGEGAEDLGPLLQLLDREQRAPGPGSETVTGRLVDLVFLALIRRWLSDQPEGAAGWLGATRDERIGRALGAIHERPAQAWSLDELAQVARMSRASFVRRFQALVGEPPMGYLARWRLSLGSALLRQTELNVGEIAQRVGYGSEFAFSKAFRRERGVSPTSYRLAAVAPA